MGPAPISDEELAALRYECPECHAAIEPYWSRGTNQWRKGTCACVVERERIRELIRERNDWLKAVGMDGRNTGYQLDNFDAGTENVAAYNAVRAYAQLLIDTFTNGDIRNGMEDNRNLVLSSKSGGVGKTMLAAGVVNLLLDEAFAVKKKQPYGENSDMIATRLKHIKWYSAPEMHKYAINDQDNFNRTLRAPLFVIDDVGKDHSKDEWRHRLYWTIMEERTNRGLPTIMTTNLNGQELEAWLGPYAFDRLDESGTFVVVSGKSFRRGGMNAVKG